MAVERFRDYVPARIDTAAGKNEPVCGRLLGYSLLAMTFLVLMFAAVYGGGVKLRANGFPSPREVKSTAPAAAVSAENVKVTTLPRALVTPKTSPYRERR